MPLSHLVACDGSQVGLGDCRVTAGAIVLSLEVESSGHVLP